MRVWVGAYTGAFVSLFHILVFLGFYRYNEKIYKPDQDRHKSCIGKY